MKNWILIPLVLAAASCSSGKKEPKNIIEAPSLAEDILLNNAMSAYDRGLYSVALQSWTELRDGYPASYYSTLAELKIADSHFFAGDYPAALLAYEEFIKMHPGHEAVPYAMYQIGRAHLQEYRGVARDQAPLRLAMKSLMQVIAEHPKSEYSVLARRELDRCREHLAEYEALVANFYKKQGYSDASAGRVQALIENYPEAKAATEARELLEQDEALVPRRQKKAQSGSPEAPNAPEIIRVRPR